MKTNYMFPVIFILCFLLDVSCQAQDPVIINVAFKPEHTYHYVEIEERTDKGETSGMDDFSSDEVPNPAIWTTRSTIHKIIHTGSGNRNSGYPITVHQHRTREIKGKGIYKEGIYQDSVIVRGTGSNESMKFDSIQLLPRNESMDRDRGKAKIREILGGYNYAAGFFDIRNRELRPGETFVNTIISSAGKPDSMIFTLKRVDKNIAVLSFSQHATYDYKTSHIDKHHELNTTGEIKVDLEKQIILERKQEDRIFELEKMTGLKSEIETNITRNITERLVEK